MIYCRGIEARWWRGYRGASVELRKAVQRALISKRMDHARPWIWRPSSGGPALTEMGRETGCELQISWYK